MNHVRETNFDRALSIFRAASISIDFGLAMKRAWRERAALWPTLLLHAGATVLMLATEISLVGMIVFVFVWILLNCFWLALARRPIVAALVSLELLLALTLLSRFKFDKLWMTVDFVDVLIIDRDTTAFLLALFPSLRWWSLPAAAATIVAIAVVWRFDRYRVGLRESLAGLAASAATLVVVALLW